MDNERIDPEELARLLEEHFPADEPDRAEVIAAATEAFKDRPRLSTFFVLRSEQGIQVIPGKVTIGKPHSLTRAGDVVPGKPDSPTRAGDVVPYKPDSLTPAADIVPAVLPPRHKPLSRIKERLTTPLEDLDAEILYQHSVLCQTCIPYRDPGDDVREWQRENGIVKLAIQAGLANDGKSFVKVGLPFGPKPRLVLYHLNAEALRTQSPLIQLEDSLTAFVKRVFGRDDGRSIRTVKEQLNRLAAADFRFGMSRDGRAVTVKGTVVKAFELWSPRDPRQKVLWPTVVQLSPEYFESLMEHAVPLVEGAVAKLSHSALALDVYTWLAQRLHRVATGGQLVPWASLKDQFGQGYDRMDNFKRVFRFTLGQVKKVYPEARFTPDEKGMQLYQSPPPVPPRALL